MRLLKLILVSAVVGLAVAAAIVAAVAYSLHAQKPWAIRTATTITAGRLDNQRTLDTRIEASLSPAEGTLTARAVLTIESLEPDREWFAFLLNPGLSISRARIASADARVHRLWCLAMLRSPKPVPKGGRVTLELEYAGAATNGGLEDGWSGISETVLPMLAFWHPLDLKSFSNFECTMAVPEGYFVRCGAETTRTAGQDGQAQVAWRYPRPVLGAAVAAGRFEQGERVHGSVVCCMSWPVAASAPAEALLDVAGSAYGSLSSMYGADGFDRLDIVVSPRVLRPLNAGSSLLLVPQALAQDTASSDGYVALASLVAQNWWGGTVGARWLASRPDGHGWLADGMARYAAWRTLRDRRGRNAFLRHVETLAPAAGQAIKQVSRIDTVSEPFAGPATASYMGPYVALMLENALGRDTVDAACRNLLAVHRYTAIGYPALAHELQLASETPLEEFFTDWVERRVDFDYAIAGVDTRPSNLLVHVSAAGRTPCSGRMAVALAGAEGVSFQTVEPGALGGEFEFVTTVPVEEVILDPFFEFPDSSRADNVWPRRVWPCAIAHARKGGVAVLAKSDWSAPCADVLMVANPSGGTHVRMTIRQPVTGAPSWLPDGRLLVPTDSGALVWSANGGMEKAPAAEAAKADKLRALAAECCAVEPAGALISTADGVVVYAGTDGTLRRCFSAEKRCETLFDVGFPLQEAEVAPDLSAVAWRDPAGSLRVTPLNDPVGRYTSVPGDVVDFSWDETGDSVLVLAAEMLPDLPMRCHARHSLWRISIPSMEAELMDVPGLDRS